MITNNKREVKKTIKLDIKPLHKAIRLKYQHQPLKMTMICAE